jgi:hypothetical protein
MRCGRCCSATIRGGPAQGAVESRVENVGGRRGEGNGRSPAALRTARGEFGGGQVRANLDPREGREALMARQVGRRSCGAEVAHRKCNLARRSCRKLRGCADRVSATHTREQWRLSS